MGDADHFKFLLESTYFPLETIHYIAYVFLSMKWGQI
jgi:hypothetical protein